MKRKYNLWRIREMMGLRGNLYWEMACGVGRIAAAAAAADEKICVQWIYSIGEGVRDDPTTERHHSAPPHAVLQHFYEQFFFIESIQAHPQWVKDSFYFCRFYKMPFGAPPAYLFSCPSTTTPTQMYMYNISLSIFVRRRRCLSRRQTARFHPFRFPFLIS